MGASVGLLVPCDQYREADKVVNAKTVICVAGLASSALEQRDARLSKYNLDLWHLNYCSISALSTSPKSTMSNLKLKLSDEDDKVELSDGRFVRYFKPKNDSEQRPVPGMRGMRTLNPGKREPDIPVWKDFIETFEPAYNLYAFNYDWRRWGDEFFVEETVDRFKEEVEDAVNHDRHRTGKAAIVGHSMGCSVILYCLSMIDMLEPGWTDTYVDEVILVAPGCGGSPSMIPSYGYAPFLATTTLPEAFSNLAAKSLGKMAASWPCMLVEMPMAVGGIVPWEPETVFAITPSKNYLLNDIGAFLEVLATCTKGRDNGPALWQGVNRMSEATRCPPSSVRVSMIYSSGIETPCCFLYETDDLSKPPRVEDSRWGDGTMIAGAIEALGHEWKKQNPNVHLLECPAKVSHKELIASQFFLSIFPKLVKRGGLEVLEVTVISAENLIDSDLVTESDPYVEFYVCKPAEDPEDQEDPEKNCDEEREHGLRKETPVIWNDLNPVWNYTEKMYAYEPGDKVFFEVWDHDPVAQDDSIGWAWLEADECMNGGVYQKKLQEVAHGWITVKVQRVPLEKPRTSKWMGAGGFRL